MAAGEEKARQLLGSSAKLELLAAGTVAVASGASRRVNWGWARVPPKATQTLPREITFNAAARALQQYPIKELESLRGAPAYQKTGVAVSGTVDLKRAAGVAKQSEIVATFDLPSAAATFGVYAASPQADAAAPLSGPSAGGTLVSLSGLSFENGSDYRCRFGEGESAGEGVTRAT